MVDYRTLKTPFYNIYVSDSSGSNFIKLPPSLLKLVEKVEILETFQSESCMHGKVAITFAEGSREPFAANIDADTSGVYGASVKTTNKIGMLADLRFESNGGVIGLTAQSAALIGKALSTASNLAGSVEGFLSFDAPPETFGNKKPPSPVRYLFQENNMIKVEWGYLEDSKLTRTVVAPVVAVQYDFPDKDMPKLTINCLSTSYALDQLSIGVGKIFGVKIPVGISENGVPILDVLGLTVGQIVQEVCTKIGMDCLISDSFLNESPAEGTGLVMNPDESIHQFFVKLAKTTHSYYKVDINPKTGKETVFLISKNELDSTLISSDATMLKYRGYNSILKSVNILADFGTPTGNRVTQIDKKGNVNSVDSRESVKTVGMFEGAEQLNTDPTSNNPITSAQLAQSSLAKTSIPVGRTEVMPANQDKIGLRESSQASAGCQADRLISMDFTTIGYPQLIPGTHSFSGLGERYTGEYHVIAITHTIDKDGYTCRGNAQSHSIFGNSGVQYLSPTQGKKKDASKSIQLFEKLSNVDAGNIGKGTIDSLTGSDSTGDKYKIFMIG